MHSGPTQGGRPRSGVGRPCWARLADCTEGYGVGCCLAQKAGNIRSSKD